MFTHRAVAEDSLLKACLHLSGIFYSRIFMKYYYDRKYPTKMKQGRRKKGVLRKLFVL
jgi:hypothetical protein